MVSGPISCVKYLVFVFNLIFFLFGVALIAVGGYVQYQLADYLDFFDSNINGPAILLIVIGLIIFIIAFFGCCGAIKENYCMVLTFSILMMVILVCQIGGAIAGFVYSRQITEVANEEMLKSMTRYDVEEHGGVTKSWDLLQKTFQCCGTKGPLDWQTVDGEKYAKQPPMSCCNDTICKEYDELKLDGCLGQIEKLFEQNVYYIGAVGIALAVIQVMGIVLSCCLARAVKKEYEVE